MKKSNQPEPPMFLRNMVCPYCKKDLTNAAKILGGYSAERIIDVMRFHIGLHREDAIAELKRAVRSVTSLDILNNIVDKIEEIENMIGCLE